MTYYYEKLTPPIAERDIASITRLYEKYGSNTDSASKSHWIFESDFSYHNNILSFVIRCEDAIVGFTSLVLKSQHGIKTGSLINFLVDEKHRSLNPAMKVQRELLFYVREHLACDILLGMPNKNSLMICKRIGYQIIDYAQRYVYITNPLEYLKHQNTVFDAIGRFYGRVIPTILKIHRNSAQMRSGNLQPGAMAIRDKYSVDKKFLSDYELWRYLESPLRNYYFFYSEDDPTEDSPLAIFCFDGDNLCVERLRNVAANRLEVWLYSLMLEAAAKFCFKAVDIDAVAGSDFHSRLTDMGFVERESNCRPLLAMSVCPTNISTTNISIDSIREKIFPILDGDLDI